MNERLFSKWRSHSCRCLVMAAGAAVFLLPLAALDAQAQGTTETSSAEAPQISQEALDSLLAPVALYPDALLAQILMAATYPMDVIEAARWQQQHPKTSGQALQTALEAYDWDPSVKSLVSVPQVLQYMNNAPRWMQDLGDAVMADQPRVMAEVQVLRRKAQEAGALTSNDKQTVKVAAEPTNNTEYITIAPVSTQVVYVPVYDPYVVYGRWWWPTPPIYWGPPAGAVFSSGYYWDRSYYSSVSLWGGFNWGGGVITINAPLYSNYYRAPPAVMGPYNAWWRPAPMYAPPVGGGQHYYGNPRYRGPYDRYRPAPVAPPPAYAPGPWGRPVNAPPPNVQPPRGQQPFNGQPNGQQPPQGRSPFTGKQPNDGPPSDRYGNRPPQVRPPQTVSPATPPQGAGDSSRDAGRNDGNRLSGRPAAVERGNGNDGSGGFRQDGGFGREGGGGGGRPWGGR